MGLTLYTEWNTALLGGPDLDEGKHLAFSLYALDVLEAEMPDLLRFLHGAGARVLVGPEMFSFSMPADRGHWFPVEKMATRLKILPWVEAQEAKH